MNTVAILSALGQLSQLALAADSIHAVVQSYRRGEITGDALADRVMALIGAEHAAARQEYEGKPRENVSGATTGVFADRAGPPR